jgi:hypothetical protein
MIAAAAALALGVGTVALFWSTPARLPDRLRERKSSRRTRRNRRRVC